MNTRSFIHNPKELLGEGKSIVNQSGDTKYIFCVAMVNFMLQRTVTATELSNLFGIPQRYTFRMGQKGCWYFFA